MVMLAPLDYQKNTPTNICQGRRIRDKADALTDACGCVTEMVSISEKRRNGAQPILQKSFEGVWGCCPIKRKVAPSRLAC